MLEDPRLKLDDAELLLKPPLLPNALLLRRLGETGAITVAPIA